MLVTALQPLKAELPMLSSPSLNVKTEILEQDWKAELSMVFMFGGITIDCKPEQA